jgi:hypothetical protein
MLLVNVFEWIDLMYLIKYFKILTQIFKKIFVVHLLCARHWGYCRNTRGPFVGSQIPMGAINEQTNTNTIFRLLQFSESKLKQDKGIESNSWVYYYKEMVGDKASVKK